MTTKTVNVENTKTFNPVATTERRVKVGSKKKATNRKVVAKAKKPTTKQINTMEFTATNSVDTALALEGGTVQVDRAQGRQLYAIFSDLAAANPTFVSAMINNGVKRKKARAKKTNK